MLTREQFIKAYGQAAHVAAGDSGLFAETILAAAIVESAGKVGGVYYPGESALAKSANNFFGIKANSSWKGDYVTMPTREYQGGVWVTVPAKFRKYGSPGESFKDYVNFLKVNPRYTTAGVFTAETPEIQAQRLQAAGYATDPGYASMLSSVIATVRRYLPPASVALTVTPLLLLVAGYYIFNKF